MTRIPPFKASGKVSRDARVQRTRGAFRRALLELLEEQALGEITIRDLAARAGTGYATFFRHYADKNALLGDLAADEIRELLARALPMLELDAGTHGSCLALCRYVEGRRNLWSVLLTGGAASSLREEFVSQAKELERRKPAFAPKSRGREPWLPDDLAVVFGVVSTVEVLTWWLQYGKGYSAEDVALMLDRLVVAPLLKP